MEQQQRDNCMERWTRFTNQWMGVYQKPFSTRPGRGSGPDSFHQPFGNRRDTLMVAV